MVHASRSHRHARVALVHTMLYRDIPCRVSTLSQDCVYACMYACISVGRSLCPGCTSRLSLFLSSFQDFVSCAGRTRKCNIEVCRHIHPSPPLFLSLSLSCSLALYRLQVWMQHCCKQSSRGRRSCRQLRISLLLRANALSMHLWAFFHIWQWIKMEMYADVLIRIFIYMCMWAYRIVCIYMYMYIYIYTYMNIWRTSIGICIYTCIYLYICILIYIFIYMYVNSHMYTYI